MEIIVELERWHMMECINWQNAWALVPQICHVSISYICMAIPNDNNRNPNRDHLVGGLDQVGGQQRRGSRL